MKVSSGVVQYVLLLVAVAGAAGFLLVAQLPQPLVADEPQFVDVAYSLATAARPLGFAGSRWTVILTHPNLYHSLLALPAFFASKAPWAARLVGVIGFALTALLVGDAARRVTRERAGPGLAVLLFALHPLALQSALLVEIDTALLPVLTALMLWYVVRAGLDLDGASWLGLGLLFGVALCAKLTTPPLVLGGLALHALVSWRPRRLARLGLAALVGVALFAAYYFPYTLFPGLPWTQPFVHSWGKAAALGGDAAGVLLGRGAKVALWLGLPFLVALALLFFSQARRRFRATAPGGEVAGAALLTAAVILVFYLLVGGEGYGFVKYHAPLVPLAALALGVAFGPQLARESKLGLLLLGAAAIAYYAYAARDPLYWPYVARELVDVQYAPVGELRKAQLLDVAFLLCPLVAAVIVTRRGGRTLAFVVLAVASAVALDGWQLGTPYEHRYNYGERGFAEAVAAVKRVDARAMVVVPVDVAFADGYRHRHWAVEETLREPRVFHAAFANPGVGAVVLRDAYFIHRPYAPALSDEMLELLGRYYSFRRYGSFTVGVRAAGWDRPAFQGAARPKKGAKK
jgi:4-amino-4-deoxy-L-arabinose transferase-like glycosyltransferase